MKFSVGDIVKILAGTGVDDDYHGRIGVVYDVDTDDLIDVELGDGEHATSLLHEDLIECDTEDVNLLIHSHLYRTIDHAKAAVDCKHLNIEYYGSGSYPKLKCIDCGLKTEGMDYETDVAVVNAWSKRVV